MVTPEEFSLSNPTQQPPYGGQPAYGQQAPGYGQQAPAYGQPVSGAGQVPPPGSVPPYGGQAYPPAPAPAQSNGFAVAGFIFGLISFVPLGLIFSIIGLVKSKAAGKGKVLSIFGIVLSILWTVGYIAIIGAAASKVNDVMSKATDPGCLSAEANLPTLTDKLNADTNDETALKADLQAIVTELKSDADKSRNADTKKALSTAATDFQQIIDAFSAGTTPSADLLTKAENDGNAADTACANLVG
jgi:hypothetical protein